MTAGAGQRESATSTLPERSETNNPSPPGLAASDGARGARHARHRASWFEPLFPSAERSRTPAWLIGLLYGAAFVGLSAVALVRQSGVPATNSVWAEDGAIFFWQSRLYGLGHNLFLPYNGYLQLGPRLFVELTRLGPVSDAAAIMATTGACLVSLVALYVFHASRGIFPSVWTRVVLVGVIVLLPLATGEILDNNVNMGWWFFFAGFWGLVTRPRNTTDALLAGLVCLLATGTEPLVALLIPLAVARILVVRTDIRQAVPVLGFVLGLVYQGIGILENHGNSSTFATATAHGALQSLGVRVGWGWLSGNDLSNHILSSSHEFVWQISGYLILLVVVGVAFLLHDRTTKFFVVTAVGFAFVTYIVPVIIRGVGPNELGPPLLVGSRYSTTPVLLVWSAVLAEVAQLVGTIDRRRAIRCLPILACLLALVPIWILDFRQTNLRTDGPRWNEQVSSAIATCKARPSSDITLQISPPGWHVVLSCNAIQ